MSRRVVGAGPVVPPFTSAELAARRHALDRAATTADVDHVVLYGANRSGSAVQWLTGWPVTREAAVVHTPGHQDVLLVNFYNHLPQARDLATDADVRWAGDRIAVGLLEELRARGASDRTRVGVVGALPLPAVRALESELGPLADLGPAYTGLRQVKSTEEIAVLRRAAALTDRSCQALAEGARPGMTDHELAALVESAYVAEGGANYIHYFAFTSMQEPEQCVPSQWPTGRRLGAGDVLSCELSTSLAVDYPGQLLRTFTVAAEPTARVEELHAVADLALERVEGVLRHGATPEEVVAAASVIEEAGCTTVDDLVHGLGGGYLPPVLGSASRTLAPLPDQCFEAGMTVVVQPNVTTPDHSLGVQTGELLLVTGDGCERLHRFPRGLGRIG